MTKQTFCIRLDAEMAEIATEAGSGNLGACIRAALLSYTLYNKIANERARNEKKLRLAEAKEAIKSQTIATRNSNAMDKKQATELKRIYDRLYKWHAQGREFELLQNNPDLREVMWPEQYAASIKHACNVNPAASIAGIYRLSDSPEEKQSIVDAIGCPAVTVEFLDYVASKTEHRIRFGWFPDPLNPEPEI